MYVLETNPLLRPLLREAARSCINPNMWWMESSWSRGMISNAASHRRLFLPAHQPNRRCERVRRGPGCVSHAWGGLRAGRCRSGAVHERSAPRPPVLTAAVRHRAHQRPLHALFLAPTKGCSWPRACAWSTRTARSRTPRRRALTGATSGRCMRAQTARGTGSCCRTWSTGSRRCTRECCNPRGTRRVSRASLQRVCAATRVCGALSDCLHCPHKPCPPPPHAAV